MSNERERQIRERAYKIWQEEGEPEGREHDHWSRAEQEHGETSGGGDELISDAGEDLPFGEPADTGTEDKALGEDTSEPPQTTAAEPTAGGASESRIASASGAVEPPAAPAPASTKPAPAAAAKKPARGKARGKPTN